MKYTKINEEISIAIAEAINAGICADVKDRMSYTGEGDNHNFIFSSTDGYDLVKTIEFIKEMIRNYNRSSNHHTSRK